MFAEDDEASESSEFEELLKPEQLCAIFNAQLIACLDEAARGRCGLFAETVAEERKWPEAEGLRTLALALQALMMRLRLDIPAGAVVEQFLDLCSIHGESHPGEARLARQFLAMLEGSGEQR